MDRAQGKGKCTHYLTPVDAEPATCTEDGNITYYVCADCSKWYEDATGHFEITDYSSVLIAALGHDWAAATCTAPKTCKRDGCGATEGAALGHDYAEEWSTNASKHWHECKRCGDKTELEAHDFGTDNECDTCGYKKSSSGSRDTSSGSRDTSTGRWKQDEKGWWYSYSNGTWPSNGWAYLPWQGSYYWYYFNADGYMAVNWLDWNNNRYYLNPVTGTNAGMMMTGWQQIGGKWYYFNPEKGSLEGILLRNTTTPDGYQVGADGAWIQ